MLARNHTDGNPKWFSEEISAIKGLVSHKVKLEGGKGVRRHLDQIRTGSFLTQVDTRDTNVK